MNFMEFVEGFKEKVEGAQRKNAERFSVPVHLAWVQSITELIEDPILRKDIQDRAARILQEQAEKKVAELQDLELSVIGLANDFSFDRLVTVLTKANKVFKDK